MSSSPVRPLFCFLKYNLNCPPPAPFFFWFRVCLSHCSITVKRYHEQGNAYERKHLVGGLLLVSVGWSIIIMVGSRQACC